MRDIQYQAEKKARAKTDPKSGLHQDKQNFLPIFSKKNSNTLLLYWKYYQKIEPEENKKFGYITLNHIFFEELNAVKRYLDSYLGEKLIEVSSASYLLLVFYF